MQLAIVAVGIATLHAYMFTMSGYSPGGFPYSALCCLATSFIVIVTDEIAIYDIMFTTIIAGICMDVYYTQAIEYGVVCIVEYRSLATMDIAAFLWITSGQLLTYRRGCHLQNAK